MNLKEQMNYFAGKTSREEYLKESENKKEQFEAFLKDDENKALLGRIAKVVASKFVSLKKERKEFTAGNLLLAVKNSYPALFDDDLSKHAIKSLVMMSIKKGAPVMGKLPNFESGVNTGDIGVGYYPSAKINEGYYEDREDTVSDLDKNSLSPADRLAKKKEREASKVKGALSAKTTEGIAKAIFSELKLDKFKDTSYKDLDKELRIKIGTLADEYEENSKKERDAAKGDKEKLKTAKVVLASELTAKIRGMLA
jgi:hypothetical protein